MIFDDVNIVRVVVADEKELSFRALDIRDMDLTAEFILKPRQ